MSKRSKSILVAVLAVVLALAVAVPAFAAVETPAGTSLGAAYRGQGNGPMMGAGVRGIDAAAKALGMDVADFAAERQAGKSLADIATSKGMSTDDLISALLAARQAALDEAAASGRITQEQAAYMLQHMSDSIADHIDDTETGPRGGSRGFGGQGMRAGGEGGCGGTCQ